MTLANTIRYDTVHLTCSKKLTVSQLSPPHGTNKKLKCETKNKTAELQLAFERRQARRTRRVLNQDSDRLHTDTQSKVSFPTVQPYTVVNTFRKK